MINTKFKNADDKTSLQALWIEVEQLDVKRGLNKALLTERIKELEDGLAKRVDVAINHNKRLKALEGETNLTTLSFSRPEKKSIWDYFKRNREYELF